MKKQVIINGVRHFVISNFKWHGRFKDMSHDLGFALLSPSGSIGFVPYHDKWLMFSTKEYEQSRR
jgi:hypothetical protein